MKGRDSDRGEAWHGVGPLRVVLQRFGPLRAQTPGPDMGPVHQKLERPCLCAALHAGHHAGFGPESGCGGSAGVPRLVAGLARTSSAPRMPSNLFFKSAALVLLRSTARIRSVPPRCGTAVHRRAGLPPGNCPQVSRPVQAILVDLLWKMRHAEGMPLNDVRDTGRGLTPAQQEQFCQHFNRLGAKRAPVEGTGRQARCCRRELDPLGQAQWARPACLPARRP